MGSLIAAIFVINHLLTHDFTIHSQCHDSFTVQTHGCHVCSKHLKTLENTYRWNNSKQFNQRANLKRHLRIPIDETPFRFVLNSIKINIIWKTLKEHTLELLKMWDTLKVFSSSHMRSQFHGFTLRYFFMNVPFLVQLI